MSAGRLPVLAAAATGIQVGAAMVATRFVIDQTTPATLALLRYAIGFLCLVPPLLAMGRVRFARRDLIPIGLLGIGQFGVLIALLNWGLQYVPAARGALIFAVFPLLTMVLAAALGHERLTGPKTAGVLLTIAGVALALGEKLLAPGRNEGEWLGALAVFGSALVGAVCSVLYRPYLRKYPTLAVSALAMLASVLFLAVLSAAEGVRAAIAGITLGGWGAVVFIGVSSGIGYYLWLWALRHAPATRVTVFLSLSPPTAALLGALLLAEPVSFGLLAGLAAVVAGLVLAHREGAAG